VHQQTGGIVSIRSQNDGRNRLSQQLALRWDQLESYGSDIQYSSMVANQVDRCDDGIESHGTMIDEKGSVLARFSQKIQFLLGGSALSLSIGIEPTRELQSLVSSSSDALSRFFTCRFAWNENDFCDIFRNIQTQFVETERQRIFSPAVLSLVSDGGAVARQGEKPMPSVKNSWLQIFSGCHPWHVRSSSHTLDTVLTTDCETPTQTFQLAIGIDLPHTIDLGFAWTATESLQVPNTPLMLPSNVRLLSAANLSNDSAGDGLSLRLLESSGQESRMRLQFSRKIHCVRWNNGVYESQVANDTGLVVNEKTIEYPLRRYELVDLEIIFCEDHNA